LRLRQPCSALARVTHLSTAEQKLHEPTDMRPAALPRLRRPRAWPSAHFTPRAAYWGSCEAWRAGPIRSRPVWASLVPRPRCFPAASVALAIAAVTGTFDPESRRLTGIFHDRFSGMRCANRDSSASLDDGGDGGAGGVEPRPESLLLVVQFHLLEPNVHCLATRSDHSVLPA